MWKILIGGDVVINNSFNSAENIDKNLISLFATSNFNIINLEAPVTNQNVGILKTGPNIKSNKQATSDFLKTLNINAVTLANNHLKDYGEKGVEDTLEYCKKLDIKTIGAGKTLSEASQTFYVETEENKISIINFAENEWASASEASAGANPMNIIDNLNQIKEAKSNSDFVIVIIHGGHEHYNLPSPNIQKLYRFYAENGADIIVGHHTHCVSGFEIWKDVPIYYSLGNFLFTKENSSMEWNTGAVLEITLKNKQMNSCLHPIVWNLNSSKLSLATSEVKEEVEIKIQSLTKIINDKKLLEEEWKQYVIKMTHSYLRYWSISAFIKNKYLKTLFAKLPIKLYNKKGLSLYLNLMRCESHRDLSISILNNKINS